MHKTKMLESQKDEIKKAPFGKTNAHNPLGFYVKAIVLPNDRIFVNILGYFVIIALIANDMIVKSPLPVSFPYIL